MPRETHTYRKTHRLSGAALAFSLSEEDAGLREKAQSSTTGRAAKTLVKEGRMRVTVVALRKGAALSPHQFAGVMSIQVLRGRAQVTAVELTTELRAGSVAVFEEEVVHAAIALTDCALLVTTAMSN